MTGPQPTEDKLLMDLIKTNRGTDGETMSRKQYEKHGDYNPWQAENKFGSWKEAKASAGIYKENVSKQRISDKEILEDMKKVNDKVDGHLSVSDYRELGEYSVSNIYNRFQSFIKARNKCYKA